MAGNYPGEPGWQGGQWTTETYSDEMNRLREENARLRAEVERLGEYISDLGRNYDLQEAEVKRLEGLILAYDHAYREELPHIASAREDDLLAEAKRIRRGE